MDYATEIYSKRKAQNVEAKYYVHLNTQIGRIKWLLLLFWYYYAVKFILLHFNYGIGVKEINQTPTEKSYSIRHVNFYYIYCIWMIMNWAEILLYRSCRDIFFSDLYIKDMIMRDYVTGVFNVQFKWYYLSRFGVYGVINYLWIEVHLVYTSNFCLM